MKGEDLTETPIGVLVSGSGTNLQALLDADRQHLLGGGTIKVVVSNRPKAQAIERAGRANVPAVVINHKKFPDRESFDREMIRVLEEHGVSLVVLAGFMRLLTPMFLSRFPGRIVNIHPALLPSFPGVDGQGQAVSHGVRISGCTVHFVNAGVDAGPVIAQAAVPHLPDEGREPLQQRILAQEHRLFPEVIRWICEGRVWLDGDRVRYRNLQAAEGALVSPPLDFDSR